MKVFPEQVTTDFFPGKLPLSNLKMTFEKSNVYTIQFENFEKKIKKKKKKVSKGLCMLLRGNILLQGNPLYR